MGRDGASTSKFMERAKIVSICWTRRFCADLTYELYAHFVTLLYFTIDGPTNSTYVGPFQKVETLNRALVLR